MAISGKRSTLVEAPGREGLRFGCVGQGRGNREVQPKMHGTEEIQDSRIPEGIYVQMEGQCEV